MLQHHKNHSAPHPRQGARRALIENVSRRSVLKGMTGFVLAMHVLPSTDAEAFPAYTHAGLGRPNGVVSDPHIFVSLAPDGTVQIVAHRAETGSGSKTSIPMIIADEMEADWSRVKIVQAPGDEPKYGNQEADGSRSIRHHIQPAREMGASVRRMLEEAAAARWGVGVDDVVASNHQVIHKTLGISLGYGDLAEAAMTLPTPARDVLRFKDEKEFRYVGKGVVQIYDLFDITTGKAVYAADVSLPGMKYAVVARPPVVGGTVASVDDTAAKAIAGVEAIIQIPGAPLGSESKPLGGVAVIATNTWAAIQGRDALVIEWKDGKHASYATEDYEEELRASARKSGEPVRDQGDAKAALAGAAKVFSQEYYQRHNVHSPMEPPAALANFADGKCEVWGCLQSPYERPPRHRRVPRHRCVKSDGERDAARRRLRAKVDGRLRDRGGLSVARGRCAGSCAMDTRGRHPAQLLSHDIGGADRDRPRRRQQAGRLAAAERGAVLPVRLDAE